MSIWSEGHKKNIGIEMRKEDLSKVFMTRLDEAKDLEETVKVYEDAKKSGFEDEEFDVSVYAKIGMYKWKMVMNSLSTCETKEDFEEFIKDMSENGVCEDWIKREFKKRYQKVVGEKYNKRIVNKK